MVNLYHFRVFRTDGQFALIEIEDVSIAEAWTAVIPEAILFAIHGEWTLESIKYEGTA